MVVVTAVAAELLVALLGMLLVLLVVLGDTATALNDQTCLGIYRLIRVELPQVMEVMTGNNNDPQDTSTNLLLVEFIRVRVRVEDKDKEGMEGMEVVDKAGKVVGINPEADSTDL